MTDLKIGDRVQWESQGCVFFPVPRKITGFSPCRQFVFVEGTNCGLPVEQVYKEVPRDRDD